MPESQRSDDYLDAQGRYPNFVTGQPYSSAYKTLAATKWSKLPVYSDSAKLLEILASLQNNSVTIVISATGSGKSVIVPRLAMKYLLSEPTDQAVRRPTKLAMTFPKSVLAEESAKFACLTWDVVLGEQIGYQFRGAPPSSHSSATVALFLTDGTLFTMSRRDPLFSGFGLVIIDEAHERSVQTDLLLERLRKALQARPALRLVIMSATIDPGIFTSYFSGSAVVNVAGQPIFKITHHWEEQNVSPEGFMKLALQRASQALQVPRRALGITDVLVFVPTTKDATKGCRLLKDSKLPVRSTTLCEGLYRKLPNELKQVVIHGRPSPPLSKKLVFATPIAQSSITLASLAAVVDSGLQLSSKWLPREQATRVTKEMTSKAQISQRVGRVGRVAPGDAYHIYSEMQYQTLQEFPDPAIVHTDLTEHFLAELCRKDMSVSVIVEDCSRLITPPTEDQIMSGMNTLLQLGLLDRDSAVVTDVGRNAQSLCDMMKVSLANSLLLLGGVLVGGQGRDDAFILACILEEAKGEVMELWSLAVVQTGDPRTPLKAHCDQLSDHVSLVRIYREVYLLHGESVARSALFTGMWDRIHTRVERNAERYLKFLPRIDLDRPGYLAIAPPVESAHASFAVPLMRVVAFARRHRQLVFEKRSKGNIEGKASSAGPLTSCQCISKPVLALNLSRPPACIGGLYDDLVEVAGQMSFSVISWVC